MNGFVESTTTTTTTTKNARQEKMKRIPFFFYFGFTIEFTIKQEKINKFLLFIENLEKKI